MKKIYIPYYIHSEDYRTDRGKLRADLYYYAPKGIEISETKTDESKEIVELVWVKINEYQKDTYNISLKLYPSSILEIKQGYIDHSNFPVYPELEEIFRKKEERERETQEETIRTMGVLEKIIPGQFQQTGDGFRINYNNEVFCIQPNEYRWVTENGGLRFLQELSDRIRTIRNRNIARKEQEKREREEREAKLRELGPRCNVNGVIYTPDEKGVINVPKWALGLLIGRKGDAIKTAQTKYGCKIILNGVEMEAPRKIKAEWILKLG